jgi:uncharacterized protein (TIGR03437 family)
VGVSKSLNRLAILGLLACGGAWAQDTAMVTVGLSSPGPAFLVDGQMYTTPQLLEWPVGSTHQVSFIQSNEPDGTVANHQYATVPGVRYSFAGWNLVGQGQLGNQPQLIVKVEPTLTEILGQVTTEYQVAVSFNGFTDPALGCSATAIPNDPRQGIALVAGTCFSSPGTMWVAAGTISLQAIPFPGYVFTNWVIGSSGSTQQSVAAFRLGSPVNITAVFLKAKRTRFRSNPPGLSLLVDQQLVQPGSIAVPTASFSADPYCTVNYSQVSVGFPTGYVPLCVGDFDFLPGSQHIIGAPAVQTDIDGRTWIFTGFSDGLGQNGVYTADFNTNVADSVVANFTPGARIRLMTSPNGLNVNVDGQDDPKGDVFIWGEGQTHHLIAPATQVDTGGRPWKFVSWSNGGSADQSYTVPSGMTGLTNLVANYQPVGQLQVLSVPSGLPFVVDGAACTTPCVLAGKSTGAKVQVVAPPSVVPDAFSRYTFGSWNGGSTASSFQVTIGDQVQVFTATYQAFYKLTATSQPPNLMSFVFNPPSFDGFFSSGTQVAVTAVPNAGYTFNHWSGDLAGTSSTASLLMNAPHSVVGVLEGFPYISENGVKNAAGDTPSGTVGPGSLISIVGEDLAATTNTSAPGELAQAIDDVWVTVNDRLLPLLSISPGSIKAQLFSDLPDGTYTLTVHRTAQGDASRDFTVQRDSPGLFQSFPPQGSPTVAAYREDGSMLTADNPATLNETISILGTGFGFYDRPMVDGFPTPDTGTWNLVDPIKVKVDGQTYTPVTARAANGSAGTVVLRVKLTGTLPSGLVDLTATVNNVNSNTVKLPIK